MSTSLLFVAPLLVTLPLKVNSLVGIKQAPNSLALVAGVGALLAMVGNPFASRFLFVMAYAFLASYQAYAAALPFSIAPALAPVILALGGGSYGVLYAVAGLCAIIGAFAVLHVKRVR
jgi:hypothetical protein